MRFIKYLLITLVIVAIVASISLYGMLNGWNINKLDQQALSKMLSPYYEVYKPEGEPPFKTIIGFHGCSGMLDGIRDWANVFKDAGYAVVLTDSMKPRDAEWRSVCAGKMLWGNERAGDAAVALQDVRAMPFVDPEHLVLMGWSHGGWSILDLLAFAAKDQTPPNLKTMPNEVLSGVKATIAIYPFCEFPAKLTNGWNQSFPVHFVFAEHDSIVDNKACEKIISQQQANGHPTTSVTYPEVDHAFDMRQSDFYEDVLSNDPETTKTAHDNMVRYLNAL